MGKTNWKRLKFGARHQGKAGTATPIFTEMETKVGRDSIFTHNHEGSKQQSGFKCIVFLPKTRFLSLTRCKEKGSQC